MIMASSSAVKCINRPKIAVTLILIILSFCFNSADQSTVPRDQKMVLGSKPPRCVNKCRSCRPCMAALVISHERGQKKGAKASPHEHDQSYFLLAWKCKCRDKYFQP